MAKTKTFNEASVEYTSKFPDKKLIVFSASSKPCVIECPEHGRQGFSTFSSILRSTSGCPECAKINRAVKSKEGYKSDYVPPKPVLSKFHEIGDRLTSAMLKNGFTPETLAKRSYIKQTELEAFLAGHKRPTFDQGEMLAHHLNTTHEWLRYGDNLYVIPEEASKRFIDLSSLSRDLGNFIKDLVALEQLQQRRLVRYG